MNPAQIMISKLENYLSEQKQADAFDTMVFDHKIEDIHFELEIVDFGKYSYSLKKFAARLTENSPTSDELREWAQRLAQRITYLLENLQILEEDTSTHRILLRSVLPEDSKSPVAYYELVLSGDGALCMRRFSYRKEQKSKTEVPFTLTKEVLEKLINDVMDASISDPQDEVS